MQVYKDKKERQPHSTRKKPVPIKMCIAEIQENPISFTWWRFNTLRKDEISGVLEIDMNEKKNQEIIFQDRKCIKGLPDLKSLRKEK